MRSALVPILLADPMPWAFKAPYAWDFLKDRARFAGGYKGALANTPGWTATPATHSAGGVLYASTASGALQSFASGTLRRTDKGVLIEGARTNLCLQSQTFDNASWTKSQTTVTADAIAAPDGTTTADKIVEDSATNVHNVNQAPTTTVASYTFSVFLKAAERTFAMLYHATSNVGTVFNLGTGAVAGNADVGAPASATITAYANGWYLCSITVTATAAANSFRIYLCSNSTTYNYAGNGTSGLYAWGAQVEAGAFPSSYIPTTTASATRAADVLTVTGLTQSAPYSLYAEAQIPVVGPNSAAWLQLGSDDNNFSTLYNSSGTTGTTIDRVGGSNDAVISTTYVSAQGSAWKMAARYSTNDTRLAVNAVLGTLDTANSPPGGSQIWIGSGTATFSPAFGYLRRAAIFSRALTDAELQSLTT